MLKNRKNFRKVAAIAACLVVTTMLVQAQTPVTIDVSTLGETNAGNDAAPTESKWQYDASGKRLYLSSANGNYTLTGTNADLCLDVIAGVTNTNITFNGLNTKGITSPIGCYLHGDGVTITLIGDNYLESATHSGFGVYNGNKTITSSASGKLTVKGMHGIWFESFTDNFIIDGNANVSVGGTSTVFQYFNCNTGNIKMSDAAKFTIANNTGSARTQKFEKYVPASTYEWKLTNATTSDPLNNAVISVTVGTEQTGTVERVNPTGINKVLADTENAKITGYFDILGRKLQAEPTKGLYIIQCDNGRMKKMMK